MDKLIVIKGETTESEFELTGSTVTIGRDAKQDITIKGSLVSRRHARLEKRPDGWYLIDAGSANGTSVNGERIDTQKLTSGDTLEIGNFTLRLVCSEAAGEEKTVLLDDEISSAAVPPAPAAPPPVAAPPPTPAPPPSAPEPAARPPVESTIYLSDDDESPPMFGTAPTAEETAQNETEQRSSKTGLIIAAAAAFLLLFFLCLCGVGFMVFKKGGF